MTARRCEKCFAKHASYWKALEAWLCKDCANGDKPKSKRK
jgi:hypothetical protein